MITLLEAIGCIAGAAALTLAIVTAVFAVADAAARRRGP